MSVTVLECPPYKARLTVSACERNRLRAVDAAENPKREGSPATLLSLRSCVHCCGVVELARMWGREPEEIEVRAQPPRSIAQWRGISKDFPRIEGSRVSKSIGVNGSAKRAAASSLASGAKTKKAGSAAPSL